jgi:hypothetical protein
MQNGYGKYLIDVLKYEGQWTGAGEKQLTES